MEEHEIRLFFLFTIYIKKIMKLQSCGRGVLKYSFIKSLSVGLPKKVGETIDDGELLLVNDLIFMMM